MIPLTDYADAIAEKGSLALRVISLEERHWTAMQTLRWARDVFEEQGLHWEAGLLAVAIEAAELDA